MLKVEGRGSTGSGEQARTRRMLVITEFALSLVLMTASDPSAAQLLGLAQCAARIQSTKCNGGTYKAARSQ